VTVRPAQTQEGAEAQDGPETQEGAEIQEGADAREGTVDPPVEAGHRRQPRGPSVPLSVPKGPVPASAVGQAPMVLALSAIGVVLVALAYQGGRTGTTGAEALYWVGHVVVFAPVVVRMLAGRLAGSAEAFLLVVGLAVMQYLLKWMYSPDQLRFPDELQHLSTTTVMLDAGRLFEPNPSLPVASDFPGLAEMGGAVAALTGLSVTAAGLLVAGVARLVLVGALFVLVRRAGGSPRLAGMTCLVYSTGQHYLFFDAMYLYQTAALPFLVLAFWAVMTVRRATVRRATGTGTSPGRAPGPPPGLRVGAAVVGVVSIVVVTVGHHVTAIIMVGALLVLAVADAVTRTRRRWSTAFFAGVAIVAVVLWFTFPARDVVRYFAPPALRMWFSLANLFAGGDRAWSVGPRWQAVVQAAGLAVLLVLLVRAGRVAVRARARDPWRYVVLAGGVVFFAGYGLWFAGPQGPELAGRITTFTYLPMSMVAALELVRLRRRRRREPADTTRSEPTGATRRREAGRSMLAGLRTRAEVGTAVAILLMLGARTGGWPPWWERLPGPHLVGGFERSVDPQSLAAARWAGAWLGTGNRIAADATGWILLATYGHQSPISGEVASAYYSPEFGLRDAQLMDQLSVEYLWVDLRMSEQTPASGSYFIGDPERGRHSVPLPRASLTKFGNLPGVKLVYDSGDIRIYDVRTL
jgi:hypothetical protein